MKPLVKHPQVHMVSADEMRLKLGWISRQMSYVGFLNMSVPIIGGGGISHLRIPKLQCE